MTMNYIKTMSTSDIEVYECKAQTIKTDYFSIRLLELAGGYTRINEEYWYSYQSSQSIPVYSNNHIKLILPYGVGSANLAYLLNILKLMKIDYKFKSGVGVWIDDNVAYEDINDIIEFSLPYNELMVEKLKLINGLFYQWIGDEIQSCIAYYVNDALIMIV